MVNHFNIKRTVLLLFFLLVDNCIAQKVNTFKGEFTNADIWEGFANFTFKNKGYEKMNFEFDKSYSLAQIPCNFFDEDMYTNSKITGCWFKIKYTTIKEIRESEEAIQIHKIISIKPIRKNKKCACLTK